MEKSKTFQDLILWQKAHDFVLGVYKCTESFPKQEIYGLTSQFRRAAVSIAANIAEGYKKKDYKNKLNFLNMLIHLLKNTVIILSFQKIWVIKMNQHLLTKMEKLANY